MDNLNYPTFVFEKMKMHVKLSESEYKRNESGKYLDSFFTNTNKITNVVLNFEPRMDMKLDISVCIKLG